VIERAREVLKRHDRASTKLSETVSPGAPTRAQERQSAGALTALDREVLEKLRGRRPRPVKPLDALNLLAELKKTNLMNDKPCLVLGMMSGTSADGIDVPWRAFQAHLPI